jgi:two-component system sensor histidine kinase GlrK
VAGDNLLSNAVKFSPSGGCISIWASKDGDTVQLDILDAGSGVDEADREKVFDPFYQGRRVLDSHVRGTGLGLSIAREYALAHGGNIELVHRVDAGAHFRLILPLRDTEGSV